MPSTHRVALLTAALLTCLFAASASQALQGNWRTYTVERSHFSISLPSGWQTVPQDDSALRRLISDLRQKGQSDLAQQYLGALNDPYQSHQFVFHAFPWPQDPAYPTVSDMAITTRNLPARLDSEGKYLHAVAVELVGNMSKDIVKSGGKVSPPRSTLLAAGPAYTVSGYAGGAKGTKTAFVMLLTGKGRTLLNITFRTDIRAYRSYEPTCAQIASTLSFSFASLPLPLARLVESQHLLRQFVGVAFTKPPLFKQWRPPAGLRARVKSAWLFDPDVRRWVVSTAPAEAATATAQTTILDPALATANHAVGLAAESRIGADEDVVAFLRLYAPYLGVWRDAVSGLDERAQLALREVRFIQGALARTQAIINRNRAGGYVSKAALKRAVSNEITSDLLGEGRIIAREDALTREGLAVLAKSDGLEARLRAMVRTRSPGEATARQIATIDPQGGIAWLKLQ